MRIRRSVLPSLFVASLAACGDDDDDAATTDRVRRHAKPTAPATAAPADDGARHHRWRPDTTMASSRPWPPAPTSSTPPSPPAASPRSSPPSQAAGLEETLRGEGPFTVFAPTDDAFAALPAGTLDTLLADPTGDLAAILTYHVVEGEVMAADVVGLDGQEVTTVNGATFTVNVGDDGAVTLTDAAGNEVAVVQTDVDASNGVIHVIDGVLLPG